MRVGPERNRKRLYFAVSAGALLVVLAGVYLVLSERRSVGSGPAGPAVPQEPFSRTWTSNKVMLVGLGDSVTFGFGARKGYGYFDRLRSNPPDEFPDLTGRSLTAVFPCLSWTNLAVSGSTSQELEQFQIPGLPKASPEILGWVVITTGGNDLIHNYGKTPPRDQAMYGASWEQAKPWIAAYEQRLNRIVGQVRERFPGGCHVFIGNIYDPTDGVGDIHRAGLPSWKDGLRILAAYNEVIQRLAEHEQDVYLIDMYNAFLGHGIHSAQFWSRHYDRRDPHYWYFVNLEDPNERGYDCIRRLFLTEMAKVAPHLQ